MHVENPLIWSLLANPPLPAENAYGHRKKLRFILDLLATCFSPQDIVLDFGCGSGQAVTRFLTYFQKIVIGVEMDRTCREYAATSLPDAYFYESLDAVHFRSIPVVICADVIEHLIKPNETLKQLGGLQPAGGWLIGSVPNGYGAFEAENWLYRTPLGIPLSMTIEVALHPSRLWHPKRSEVPYNNASPHVQFFTLDSLRHLAETSGYDVLRIVPGVVLGSPPISCHLIERFQTLLWLNGIVADRLPLKWAANWFFVWRKR